jgi:iron-sulfur cluster assembly accessory protein
MEEEKPPISLTENAAKKVLEIRTKENIAPEKVLRLGIIGGGCSGFNYDLKFDDPKPDDRRYVFHGAEVAVDEMSLMYLLGTELDYVETLAGAGFRFNNPNVKSTCGCGSSFTVD